MKPIDALAHARFSPHKLDKVNLFDSPRMFLDVYGLEPGQAQKVHRHDDADKVYYALEGNGVVTLGDREHPLAKGQVTVCPAGIDHGVANPGNERLVLLVVMTKAHGS